MTKRIATTLVPLLLAAAVAAATSGAATTPPNTMAKYRACLKSHGVTFGKLASAAKTRAAFRACASLAPRGAAGGPNGFRPNGGRRFNSAAFKKFAACMSKHGVAFSRTKRPNLDSASFKAAQKACASLRPKRPATTG